MTPKQKALAWARKVWGPDGVAARRKNAHLHDGDYHRKQQTNIRLTDEGVAMLRALSSFYGTGMSGVIEMLVRERVHERKLSVSTFLKPTRKRKKK